MTSEDIYGIIKMNDYTKNSVYTTLYTEKHIQDLKTKRRNFSKM